MFNDCFLGVSRIRICIVVEVMDLNEKVYTRKVISKGWKV